MTDELSRCVSERYCFLEEAIAEFVDGEDSDFVSEELTQLNRCRRNNVYQ